MEQRITFITLGVNDLKTSTGFYEQTLGWEHAAMSNDDLVVYQLNGIMIALYPREELAKDAAVAADGSGFKGFTLSHNVWSEEEVDELVKTLKEKGVNIIKEPQHVFWGGYSSYIADPDGYLWEIAYNPYLKKD